jgi:hypothetical protein
MATDYCSLELVVEDLLTVSERSELTFRFDVENVVGNDRNHIPDRGAAEGWGIDDTQLSLTGIAEVRGNYHG